MRNSFIIWITTLALLAAVRSQAQMQFESSVDYGQIFDVTFDPNHQDVVYARTVANHIVKSTDRGESWEVIYSRPQENWFVTIKDMRVINNGQALSFICSAEGTTFNKVVIFDLGSQSVIKEFSSPIETEPGNLIQSYSLYPGNNDIMLMHTTKMVSFSLVTEVFYTNNGGESWESVYYSPDNVDIHVNNVAVYPDNPEKFFIMRGGSPNPVEGGLLISEDAGATWTEKIAGTVYSAIAFNPSNPDDIFLGTFYLSGDQEENLYRSTDGGNSWEIVDINWTSMSTNSIHSITFNPSDPNNIMVLEENEIAVSNDRGSTWTNHVYEEIDPEDYYYGLTASFNPFAEDEVIISANYYPFISQDGGETLEKFLSPFVNSSGRTAVHNTDESHVYYGLRNGFMHKDIESGEEQGYNLLPLDNMPMFSSSGIYADPNVVGRVFYSNMSGMMGNTSLMMSNEHGENLLNIFNGSYLMMMSIGSFEPDTNKILVSMGEILYKFDLTDLENITSQEIMPPSFGYVTNTVFDPEDENTFFISQVNKIYKTADNGQTWEELSNGLELLSDGQYVYDLKRNPFNEQEFAIATSQGIFRSADNGESWTRLYDAKPMNSVEFSPFEGGKIVASSIFQDGVEYPSSEASIVYSKDAGETWEEIGTDVLGYMRSNSTEIMFTGEDSADAYFLTQDLGLVKYTLDVTTLGTGEWTNNHANAVLYPNPTTGIINIDMKSEIQNIVVYDLSGRKVLEQKTSPVNISALPKGIYLVNVLTKAGKTATVKVLKQ